MIDTNASYYILLVSVILYLAAYARRIEPGERYIKITPFLEKILFPFSKEGEAALISIIIAAYIEVSLLISYAAMGILKLPADRVNTIWSMGTWSMLLLGTGVSIFHEVPASRERKALKILVYIIGAGCILGGGHALIELVMKLFTTFARTE